MLEWVGEGGIRVDRVDVAPPDAVPRQVSSLFQLADELLCRALRHPHAPGDLAQAQVGVSRHAEKYVGVLGEKVEGHVPIVVSVWTESK